MTQGRSTQPGSAGFFFLATLQHVGSRLPQPGTEPEPPTLESRVLTTGPPGESAELAWNTEERAQAGAGRQVPLAAEKGTEVDSRLEPPGGNTALQTPRFEPLRPTSKL